MSSQESSNVIYEAFPSGGGGKGEPADIVAEPAPLKKGGGGGNSGDMETRLTRMEVTVEHIDRNVSRMTPDLANVRERMATLEERVAHLPGKGFIVGVTTASLMLIAALIAFSDQIGKLVTASGS